MIFFISDGRLGNQLFQYAYLNSVVKEHEIVICFNMDIFRKNLSLHNKNFIFIPKAKFILLFNHRITGFFYYLAKLGLLTFVKELDTTLIPKNRILKSKGFLPITFIRTGFFQSEDFFSNRAVDFRIKNQDIKKAQEILFQFNHENIVFVHVRRGDYLNEIYEGKKDISLPMTYYKSSIELFYKDLKIPFFIFLTDDYDFVKKEFSYLTNKHISQESMMVDLAIMSLCDYGIVSNSSFSWWGAFLSKNKKKMVFPKYWFGWKSKKESHVRIQPDWVVLMDINNE